MPEFIRNNYVNSEFHRSSSNTVRKDRLHTKLYDSRHREGGNREELQFTDPALQWLFLGESQDKHLKQFGLTNFDVVGEWCESISLGRMPIKDLHGQQRQFRDMNEVEWHAKSFLGHNYRQLQILYKRIIAGKSSHYSGKFGNSSSNES